ncbi:MAG: J domain-containing protein [Cyanobacteria bacterium]|nr:J domain-containing protein [Cyanobacteriota bacterium]MDA1020849.1 J domain-containing protein [Cyanobacteriota bacterium]
MSVSFKLEDNFADLYSTTSLVEIGVDMPRIIRTVEAMNASSQELCPQNLAYQLGIPKALLYQDLEILEYIYKNQESLVGADKLIANLIQKIKFKNRHITRLKNQLQDHSKNSESSFNEGFVQGAAISYQKKPSNTDLAKEVWARGTLYLSIDDELNAQTIKSAYRRLVTLFHPDQSAKDTADYLDTLKKAYDLLMSFYS